VSATRLNSRRGVGADGVQVLVESTPVTRRRADWPIDQCDPRVERELRRRDGLRVTDGNPIGFIHQTIIE